MDFTFLHSTNVMVNFLNSRYTRARSESAGSTKASQRMPYTSCPSLGSAAGSWTPATVGQGHLPLVALAVIASKPGTPPGRPT